MLVLLYQPPADLPPRQLCAGRLKPSQPVAFAAAERRQQCGTHGRIGKCRPT
jgi:hypothetical protein